MAQVIYTIQDGKLDEFKIGFLKVYPIPIDEDTDDPIMTENEWIKECGKQFFISKYRKGKKLLGQEQAIFVENLIE